MFLASTAIDLVRRGGHKLIQVAPLQPLAALIEDFQKRSEVIWACPLCVQSRGYQQADFRRTILTSSSLSRHQIAIRAGGEERSANRLNLR